MGRWEWIAPSHGGFQLGKWGYPQSKLVGDTFQGKSPSEIRMMMTGGTPSWLRKPPYFRVWEVGRFLRLETKDAIFWPTNNLSNSRKILYSGLLDVFSMVESYGDIWNNKWLKNHAKTMKKQWIMTVFFKSNKVKVAVRPTNMGKSDDFMWCSSRFWRGSLG